MKRNPLQRADIAAQKWKMIPTVGAVRNATAVRLL